MWLDNIVFIVYILFVLFYQIIVTYNNEVK